MGLVDPLEASQDYPWLSNLRERFTFAHARCKTSVHVRCLFGITQGFSLITYQDPAFNVLFLDELSKYI